jgi:hypothetical protein
MYVAIGIGLIALIIVCCLANCRCKKKEKQPIHDRESTFAGIPEPVAEVSD